MSGKKKSRKNNALEKLVLAAAILKLIETLAEIVKKFLE